MVGVGSSICCLRRFIFSCLLMEARIYKRTEGRELRVGQRTVFKMVGAPSTTATRTLALLRTRPTTELDARRCRARHIQYVERCAISPHPVIMLALTWRSRVAMADG